MILYDPGLIYRIISDILRNKHMNIKEEDMSKKCYCCGINEISDEFAHAQISTYNNASSV